MKRFIGYVLGVFVGGVGIASAQQDFDKVVIKAIPVAGAVHMLEGSGGNIGVSAGEDGILIVDDQFAPLADKIKAALRGLGSGTGNPKFLLNTHFHGDHTGGNPIFGREATIVAQANVRHRLAAEQRSGDRVTPPMVKQGLPVLTFDQGLSIHFNGEEIKMMSAPVGHTDTDAFVYFTKSNVIHLGDHFFNGRFPYVDLAGGGTVDGLIRNIGTALNIVGPDTKIIPGHGALANKGDLHAYYSMLIETTDLIRSGIAKGLSLDEAKKAGFPEKWKGWGSGFISADRYIETLYKSYAK